MLNTDGKLTKEGGSYAGILRQSDGSVVMAYHGGSKATYIGAIEIEAIQKGLEVALELKIKNIQVRTDSMEAVNCILGICTPTWRTKAMVNSINAKIGTMEGFNIKHTFRESNKAADWLTKCCGGADICKIFCNPLEKELETIVQQDAAETIYIRV
ncbi:hypothetical protein FRX31_014326 [Thalictrum thalictroides]|uniref:RNase H type-1 domain-containing protein n=1 Tax=Thalictrum thalictroides TaxID=46969 RepID=A0A7J6WF98_THATH|nr:hypothetical protein FRX31_014326 [Thalictrum thalictroides]